LLSLTGLTTGGVTAALDRLEKAGYIRRQPNPGDRRSVLVRAIPRRVRRVKANYRTNERRWNALLDGFAEAELRAVLKFFTSTNAVPPAAYKK
jgi:DNA-binding MarR family transcriptional regulator